MDYNYPLLRKVFNHYKGHNIDLTDIYLVCCQHILEEQKKMFELFIDFGFKPNKIIILGKVYSTNPGVLNEIRLLGINALQPEFSGVSFDEEHINNCGTILSLIPKDAGVVLLDDGAELIKTFIEAQRRVLFAVEQTSSGFRKLENDQLPFPVVNVARSMTKLVQESPLIARLCFERINNYLSDQKIINPLVLVVGLGPIGESVLQVFEQNNFIVVGFEIKLGHHDLVSFIQNKKPDIIIGATGSNILSRNEIEQIISEKPIYLVSVSSSDREFPVVFFRKGKEVHDDVLYKNLIFLNNGFPITFKGNRNELTPLEIEKTLCLLGGSVMDGVVNRVENIGLVNVSEDLERLIN
jgi:S-adenosylhomocysteine hydrolase